MTNEDKLIFLNNELIDSLKENQRIQNIVDFFSDELVEYPLFYMPIKQDQTYILNQMQDKIQWIQEKIQEIEEQ